MVDKSWNPLSSTLCPLLIEIFTSCLIVPSPLLTLQARKSLPKARAAFCTSSGFLSWGLVVTSRRGIPNLSRDIHPYFYHVGKNPPLSKFDPILIFLLHIQSGHRQQSIQFFENRLYLNHQPRTNEPTIRPRNN